MGKRDYEGWALLAIAMLLTAVSIFVEGHFILKHW